MACRGDQLILRCRYIKMKHVYHTESVAMRLEPGTYIHTCRVKKKLQQIRPLGCG